MGSSTEQYCLTWNDFQSSITGAFSDIRDDGDFLDVTLVSDGQIARAHKLVLSACSPLFRQMLKKNTHPQPLIFLHGVKYNDMTAILNFMYHGEVNVNQEDLQTFLAAAEELRIRGLSDKSAMDSNSSNKNTKSASNVKKESSTPSGVKRMRTAASAGGIVNPKSDPKENVEAKKNKLDSNRGHKQQHQQSDYQDNSSNQSENYGYGYDGNNMNLYNKEEDAANGLAGEWFQDQHQLFFGGGGDQQQQQQQNNRPVCPYCHKELKNAHSLNVHISRYHTEGSQADQEVICPVCERKYGNKYSLRTHMHLNHKDQVHLLGSSGRKGRKGGNGSGKSEKAGKEEEEEGEFGYFQ